MPPSQTGKHKSSSHCSQQISVRSIYINSTPVNIPHLLQHPEELDQETLYDLRRIVAVYPTYHAARILFLQNLFLLHDPTFDQELRRAALLVPDRRVLYNITQPRATVAPQADATAPDDTAAPADSIEAPSPAAELPDDSNTESPAVSPSATSRTPRKKYASSDSTSRLLDNFLSTSSPLPKRRIKADPASDYMAYIIENGESFGTEVSGAASMTTTTDGPTTEAATDIVVTRKPDTSSKPAQSLSKGDRMDDLISGFIDTYAKEGISLSEDPEVPDDVSNESEANNDPTLTETLANIYIRQQKYERAIEVLTKSQSKSPRANPYLADQVRFLQKLAINERHKNRKK